MVMSGAAWVLGSLAAVAVGAYLVRRWRLLAHLGTALALGALARALWIGWGEGLRDLVDLLLWPGCGLRLGLVVELGAPLAVAGRVWSLDAVGLGWLALWLWAGAGFVLLAFVASREERLPALVALALVGAIGLAAAESSAWGLWGGALCLCALAVLMGDRESALLLLGGGAIGLVALSVARGAEGGRVALLSGAAAALGLGFWFGCPPWGPWGSAACRRAEPMAAGFALALLPSLGWRVLAGTLAAEGQAWWEAGAAWLLVVGGAGAWVHRSPRDLWKDAALLHLGALCLVAARGGVGWQEVGVAWGLRAAALAALGLGFAWTPGGPSPGAGWRHPCAIVAVVVGLAALVGLPPWPAFGLWREALAATATGQGGLLPGWATWLGVVGLVAGAWGSFRALWRLLRADLTEVASTASR